MNQFTNPEMLLRILTEPRRNNFFYGKMLDVPQLRLEQDYGKKKQWLMNRLSLGTGVLCGLNVAIDGGKLCVDAGVAIDPLGREIIVPGRFCIDPFAPKPPCERGWKGPADDPAAAPKGPATLWVCYNECTTDQVPSAISDCHGDRRCEAGTIVETFKFRITEGAIDGPRFTPDFCVPLQAIFGGKQKPDDAGAGNGQQPQAAQQAGQGDGTIVVAEKKADPHALLCEILKNDCSVVDGPVCVPIATFSYLGENEIGDLAVCEARNRLYSNQVLLELILCLMARVEECCGKHPPEGPPPPADDTLRITAVEVESATGQPTRSMTDAELQASRKGMVLPEGFQPVSMTIRFNKPVDRESVSLTSSDDDLAKCSMDFEGIRVLADGTINFTGYVKGDISFLDGDKAVHIKYIDGALRPGIYQAEVTGDLDPVRACVKSAGDHRRLDGEADKFPSGRGDDGGRFFFYLTVEGKPDETLRITGVDVTSGSGQPTRSMTDAELQASPKGMVLPNGFQPTVITIRFNKPVDRKSVSLPKNDAELGLRSLNLAAIRFVGAGGGGFGFAGVVQGAVSFADGDKTVVIKLRAGPLQPGTYQGEVNGDADPARPSVKSAADQRLLDGEPDKFPSGRGDDGGRFVFYLTVEGEADETLRITALEATSGSGQPTRSMTDEELRTRPKGMVLPDGFQPTAITVRFNKPVDRKSVSLSTSDDDLGKCSMDLEGIRVLPNGSIEFTGYVQGAISFADGDKAVVIKMRDGALRPGIYQGEITGDPDAVRASIKSAAGQRQLDGEPDKFPSGRGDDGGRFFYYISVEGDPAVETLRIEGAEIVVSPGLPTPKLEDPSKPILAVITMEPRALRVRFTNDVQRDSVITLSSDEVAKKANFVVWRARGDTPILPVQGDLSWEDERTVLFKPRDGGFAISDYVVVLAGNAADEHGAILARSDGSRLDGEPAALPSGDGTEGGDFRFRMSVKRA